MMCAFLSGKKDQDTYVKSFGHSSDAKIIYTRHQVFQSQSSQVKVKNLLPGYNSVAFAGLLRGNAHILDMALRDNLNFYYIDHAYFNPGYKYPNWMRVTKNGFVQNTILPNVDTERLKLFDIKFKEYNFNKKQNIVVFPPSDTVARVFNKTNWEAETIKKIKEYTDRPIVVRRKSGPVMDNLMITAKNTEKYHYDESLDNVLNNAYCVVAFNSAVALTALERGIPVICERYCAAYPLTHSFSELEKLKEKERTQLFASLSWGQFTMEEITNKKTFKFINSITQWKGSMK